MSPAQVTLRREKFAYEAAYEYVKAAGLMQRRCQQLRGLAGIAIWGSAFDVARQDRSAGAFTEPPMQSNEMEKTEKQKS